MPTAPLREADLFTLWLEQRFPVGALRTVGGVPVRVLYRGRPGSGAGPDFRDARISIGGAAPQLGDVELHVGAGDFRRHGHGGDPAYRNVVLHVVFDADGVSETPLLGGGRAPVVALRPWVAERSAELLAWLERSRPWREPCHTALDRLGGAAVERVLLDGGLRRLRTKAAAIAAELGGDDAEQVLYRAVCGALGLRLNVAPFRALADRLPYAALMAEAEGDQAIGGGLDSGGGGHAGQGGAAARGGGPRAQGGDMPGQVGHGGPPLRAGLSSSDVEARIRARLRRAAGFDAEAPVLGALPWRLSGLRPNAHPAKRIDGLAVILARHRGPGLRAGLTTVADARGLLRALAAPGIGRERAVEMAVNAVLPYLMATGDDERAIALAGALPAAAAYGTLMTLSTALADDSRSLPARSALHQQGALALSAEWCRRGGCGVCPLS